MTKTGRILKLYRYLGVTFCINIIVSNFLIAFSEFNETFFEPVFTYASSLFSCQAYITVPNPYKDYIPTILYPAGFFIRIQNERLRFTTSAIVIRVEHPLFFSVVMTTPRVHSECTPWWRKSMRRRQIYNIQAKGRIL